MWYSRTSLLRSVYTVKLVILGHPTVYGDKMFLHVWHCRLLPLKIYQPRTSNFFYSDRWVPSWQVLLYYRKRSPIRGPSENMLVNFHINLLTWHWEVIAQCKNRNIEVLLYFTLSFFGRTGTMDCELGVRLLTMRRWAYSDWASLPSFAMS